MFKSLINARQRIIAISTAIAMSVIISSCGSPAGGFDYAGELEIYKTYSDLCGTNVMGPTNFESQFLSSSYKEAEKYWWVDYSENDYYQYRLEDPSFLEDDLKTSEDFTSCADYLKKDIERFKDYSEPEYETLTGLYLKLSMNVIGAARAFKAMHDLPNIKASRAEYMDLEDQARSLEISRREIFLAIRQIIDVAYIDNVQAFILNCPTYLNFPGHVENEDGIVYLKNLGDSEQEVNLTIRITDKDGLIVGEDYINTSVPGNSTVKTTITAANASSPVGGISFPPRCYIDAN